MSRKKILLQKRLNKPYIYIKFKDAWYVLSSSTNMSVCSMVSAFAPGLNGSLMLARPIKKPLEKNYIESTNVLAYLEKSSEVGSLNLITRTAFVIIRIPENFPKDLIDIKMYNKR